MTKVPIIWKPVQWFPLQIRNLCHEIISPNMGVKGEVILPLPHAGFRLIIHNM